LDGREVVSAVGFAGISGNLRVAVIVRGGGADCGRKMEKSMPICLVFLALLFLVQTA
jgi:hypothetical protein